ncbi:MAG: hypothetical protein R3C02_04785 [Planctomycetaceae bacterium]
MIWTGRGRHGWVGVFGSAFSNALAEAGRPLSSAADVLSGLKVWPTIGVAAGADASRREVDQLDEPSQDAGFDAAVEAAGKVDILVNNGQKGHAMDLTNVTGEAFSTDL